MVALIELRLLSLLISLLCCVVQYVRLRDFLSRATYYSVSCLAWFLHELLWCALSIILPERSICNEIMSPRTAQKHTKGTFAGLNAFVCDAIILILNLAFYSLVAPTARAIELSVCRDYFLIHQPSKIGPAGSVEEKFCKADSIQQRLAWLLALNGILRFAIGN